MAVFRNHPNEWHDHDWTILRNGSISAYWRMEFLNKDIEWFQKAGYKIVRFKCTRWTDEEAMHDDFYEKLHLPDYYGSNFDALDECLEDIVVEEKGLVIVFEELDSLTPQRQHLLLNIFDRGSRFHLLMGSRMINLVQVNNPNTSFEPINAYSIHWNRREWYEKDRLIK